VAPKFGEEVERSGDPIFGRPTKAPKSRVWLGLESGVYIQFFKDGEDSDGEPIPFGFGHGVAFSFEPIVEVSSFRRGSLTIYHGVGVSSLVMASTDFERTGNLGYKFRPFGIEWGKSWSLAANVRLFPDGFGADEFGAGPPPTGDRPTEVSLGVAFSF
jgi:hypothetical protein